VGTLARQGHRRRARLADAQQRGTKTKPSAFFNYRVIVPIECVADRSLTSHQVNLFDMDMKYADVVPLAEVLSHLARG
jgi:hypothetical protein